MKLIFLVFAGLASPFMLISYAKADSACWPEEELVGKTASGFVRGINYKEFQPFMLKFDDEPKPKEKCQVKVFRSAEGKAGRFIPCDSIQCIKGECGDEGEHTSLPVEDSKKLFVQIRLKDRKKSWLKFSKPQEIEPILVPGTVGTLFPDTARVLDAPNGKRLTITSPKELAYTVKKILKVNHEQWAEVEVNPILNPEPEVRTGKSIGTGFILYRDKQNKISTVLSEIWCD